LKIVAAICLPLLNYWIVYYNLYLFYYLIIGDKLNDSNALKRASYILLSLGLAIGILFDILFYNKTLGISYPIFIASLLVVFFISMLISKVSINKKALVLIVPILALSAISGIYSNMVLRILNFLLIPILMIALSALATNINKAHWSDFRFIADMVKRVFIPFGSIHKPFTTFFGMISLDTGDKRKTVALKIFIGVIISVPLLAIIIWLLSSADIVFKNLFTDIPFRTMIKHIFIVLPISIYIFSFIFSIFKAKESNERKVYDKIGWKSFIDPTVLLTILSLLNIVYIVFAVIQFTYLFGGDTFILPSSFSYAEYARRGFFELVVVTVINFVILFFSITFVRKEGRKANIVIKSFLSALVFFTFILLISAFYRMVLYEMAYGYTYLRIFVQAFMILLFLLFIINLIYIWYSKMPIISAYILCSLILFIILNFANVDVIIAKNNINRYQSTGEIDIDYLEGLSYDAIAVTAGLLDCQDEEIAAQVKDYFEREKKILAEQSNWQSINLSKIRAQRILDKYID